MKERAKTTQDPIVQYYGFQQMPFGRSDRVDCLMPIDGQEEMQARLLQAIREQGIALVTGQGGCGKSTALRRFVHSLDNNRYLILYVPNPAPGLTGVYRDILKTLGYEPTYFRPQLVSQVRIALTDVAARGRQVVVLFDEAHRLTDTWLEDLRMLLSADMDSRSLATLVLVGHPDLRERLRMTVLDALRSRINIRYQLRPLTIEETARYIAHHVKTVGYHGDALFSDGFIAKAYEYTRGIPRVINQLCRISLVAAMVGGTRLIDETIFHKAHLEMEDSL